MRLPLLRREGPPSERKPLLPEKLPEMRQPDDPVCLNLNHAHFRIQMSGLRRSDRDSGPIDTIRFRLNLQSLPGTKSAKDDLVTRGRNDRSVLPHGEDLLRKR